jgi:hypothetical protein
MPDRAAPLPEPLDRILPRFVDDARSTFRSELVGVYLYGSAVMGGFDATLSDLDLVVVTERSTEDMGFDVFARLTERLQAREPEWADRLDIVFVGRRTLAKFRSGGAFLEIGHPRPLRRIPDASQYVETWFLMRAADRPIAGPSATTLMPLISTREFLSEVVAGIDGFIAAVHDDTPTGTVAYRVLTLCRVLRSLESGEVCTKQEGADWAAERYPAWAALIRAARAVRASNGADELAPEMRARIPAFLDFMGHEIHRVAAANGT